MWFVAMNTHDEHDDNLAPEEIQGEEMETENYVETEDEEIAGDPVGKGEASAAEEDRTSADSDEDDDDGASDTI